MLSFPVSAFSLLSPTERRHTFTQSEDTTAFDAEKEAIFINKSRNGSLLPEWQANPADGKMRWVKWKNGYLA